MPISSSVRIHQVEPRKTVQKEHAEIAESGIKQLWGWVSPEATARACILSLESKKFEGRHESAFTSSSATIASEY